MKTKYEVVNKYGIKGVSTHRTPGAALKAARKREGEGWEVWDTEGNRWESDFEGVARITIRSYEREG